MPIIPKFTWDETESEVTLKIYLKGSQQSNINLFCSSALLKLNSPPYLLIIDLFKNVDEASSSALRRHDEFIVTLAKKQVGLWGRLTAVGDKSSVAERRNASVQESCDKVANDALQRRQWRQQALRVASDRQFGLEGEKRRVIEARKQKELENERDALAHWEKDHSQHCLRNIQEKKENLEGLSDSKAGVPQRKEAANAQDNSKLNGCDPGLGQQVWLETELHDDPTANANLDWGLEFKPVRSTAEAVPVYFTKLETPNLPAREQREEELKLYKKFVGDKDNCEEELKIGEKLPAFLKDKGDSLYAQGNYKGAINAYSRAIEIDPQQMMCYTNRSVCYLKLGEHRACIADCSSAIKGLTLEEENCSSGSTKWLKLQTCIAKLFGRRGISRSHVDDLEDAVKDFEISLKYNPDDRDTRENLAEVRACVGPQSTESIMVQGLSRYSCGNFAGARDSFSALLECGSLSNTEKSKLHANRAACHLALEEFHAACIDCDNAMKILCNQEDIYLIEEEILSKSSESRSRYSTDVAQRLCRLFCRKAAILGHERNYLMALKQYECAKQLGSDYYVGNSHTIDIDMAKIQSLLEIETLG